MQKRNHPTPDLLDAAKDNALLVQNARQIQPR
jgi:hypothetical protein